MRTVVATILVMLLGLIPVSTFAANENLALSAGLGFVYPMGDMGDVIDYAVSLPLGVQYAVVPNVSLEFDAYYYLYTAEAESGFDYSSYQFGLGARYWMDKAFNGLYVGAGLARTNVEIEFDFFGTKITADDDFTTLVVKAGYTIPLNPIILDLGVRYDAIDMDDWADQPLTLYAMAVYPLSMR